MIQSGQLYTDPKAEPGTLREGLVIGYLRPDISRAGSDHELLVVTDAEKFRSQWDRGITIFGGEAPFPENEQLKDFGVERVRMHRFEPGEYAVWRSALSSIRELSSTRKQER